MIDFHKETLLTLSELAKELRVTYRVLHNIAKVGRVGVNGERVFLETAQNQTGECSTREAYYRFLEQMNGRHVS